MYFACKSANLHAIYTRVNAATPVTCIVILTFNRNCEDYNEQKDIYPREHQFPQGLLCADFLRRLVTSGSEVQGILKALVHWKTTTYNNSYLVWLQRRSQDHLLLNAFIKGWLFWILAHWASKLEKLELAQQENLLVPDYRTGLCSSPV